MKKRELLKNLGLATMGLAAKSIKPNSFGLSNWFNEENSLPNKWVWIRPDISKSDEYWEKKFDLLVNAGIEGILPQIYASNETLFEHPYLKVTAPWLERIIPIAHRFGLQVHAWMWSMIMNNPEIIEKHPDWFSVNRLGQPSNSHPAYVGYYKFMDPCHPEVRNYLKDMVKALANIEDLDGIHLDYIRQPDVILAKGLQPKYNIVQDKEYPEYDYPYSIRCREAFIEQSSIDPLELGDQAPFNEEWRQFRYDMITELVNEYLVPAAKAKNKKITAAVFPNWQSVRQQWHNWNLDGFFPMLYHGFYEKEISWIGEQIAISKKRIKPHQKIFSGVYMPHFKTETELQKAIKVSLDNRADGFAIFESNNLRTEHYQMLNKLK